MLSKHINLGGGLMVIKNKDGTYDISGYGIGEPIYHVTRAELDELRCEIESIRLEDNNE